MADARRRKLERAARTGDPDAKARLPLERCRTGQCCAHALEAVPIKAQFSLGNIITEGGDPFTLADEPLIVRIDLHMFVTHGNMPHAFKELARRLGMSLPKDLVFPGDKQPVIWSPPGRSPRARRRRR